MKINDQKAVQQWIDNLEPITPERVSELDDELVKIIREHGSVSGYKTWFEPLLDQWLGNLAEGRVDLEVDTMARIAVGVNRVYSMRDAILLSFATSADRDTLLKIATQPRAKGTAETVNELLNAAYTGKTHPDKIRCRTALAMLAGIASIIPDSVVNVQPIAMMAYAYWWLGDRKALPYALQTLSIDESNGLALLILEALSRGARPAQN